jgi:hypothetical protein
VFHVHSCCEQLRSLNRRRGWQEIIMRVSGATAGDDGQQGAPAGAPALEVDRAWWGRRVNRACTTEPDSHVPVDRCPVTGARGAATQ